MDATPAKTPLEMLTDGTFREVTLPNGRPATTGAHGGNIFCVLRDQAKWQNARTIEQGQRIDAIEAAVRKIERDLAEVGKLRQQVAGLKRQLTATRLQMARRKATDANHAHDPQR